MTEPLPDIPNGSSPPPIPFSQQISCGGCHDQGFTQIIRFHVLTAEQLEWLEASRQTNPWQADYIRRVWSEEAIGLEPCECTKLKQAKVWQDYCIAECGLPQASLERQTFENWDAILNPDCNLGYEATKLLVGGSAKGWLILYGLHGLGKTHLLVAATGFLAEAGKNVRYISAPALYERMIAAVKENNYVVEMESLKHQTVLLLDDLGAERATDFAREVIHSILDHRYQERMTTVLAANVNSLTDFPSRLASRMTDASLVESVHMVGKDARPRLPEA